MACPRRDLRPYRSDEMAVTLLGMMDEWHDGWGWGGWLAMGLMMVAFWGLMAALVVYVLRSSGRHVQCEQRTETHPGDQALGILDERFARGDIDVEEYTRRRELLRAR
jgi:putative membrane protein